MREKASRTPRDERILVFGLAIFVCVFFGPFATSDDLTFWNRVAFWTIGISVIGYIIEACMIAIRDSPTFARVHIVFRLFLGALVGAVPGTSFIVAINMLFRPDHLETVNFPTLWAQVSIMALLIAGLEHLIWTRFRAQPEIELKTHSPPKDEEPQIADDATIKPAAVMIPRLYQRLPDRLREAQIISMSMQDHYVEVTTTLGSDMLLMRLSDAVDLLDGMPGTQTHRSHWVSCKHSASLAKSGRRYEVTLSDGRTLPVSNRNKDALEQMLNGKRQA
ncbi:LytTR family DNA-binding domain-containing protein [Planktotalea arctica]|uniref:LytTR family DNA-binding domain-containing protein n=1 Tax=Planktotalea arctica TaxID=1481893 RepID=UPI003219A9F1